VVTIRPATAADQDTIVRLIREADINPLDLKWPNFVLAVDNATGAVVGTGQIKHHGDGSDELASIATVPAYQHRGIAHQIIEHLLARHPGVLYLTCMDYLESLYQRFGFHTIGPDEMTPYFKRITRLAKTFFVLSGTQNKLLVMKREPGRGGEEAQ
jgi:N-acetylglutamate synthase-like GNAT family acetyltransferase